MDKAPALLSKPACLPINRCNVPAAILGSLAFQENPVPLVLDGVREFHRDLFARLDATPLSSQRSTLFQDYVTVHFRLEHLEEAGLVARDTGGHQKQRAKANYIRMIRGWNFDADSREGAVMKAWVESRFGLTPRYHGEPLRDFSAPAYQRYLEMRAQGLYGTNALEAQLDLVYTYCQYEFSRQTPDLRHLTLYRGVNHLAGFERLPENNSPSEKRRTLLLNNLNSITGTRERADEFGDAILTFKVPVAKIFFHCRLLSGILQGEDEFLTIGGLYEADYA
ncbi:MAG: NAD(+)--dinitrogen-reductase ADP-D-ribosyltransferase [Zoogloeaceae bacterium]|jgi:NAD+--dinitrogen-reductase ADP-D-ribosyltransferase|nr:NAD(+)--dinitrogen-reductase ADP-D-ribosyltransferase [Zoogloeaceae bacterium]